MNRAIWLTCVLLGLAQVGSAQERFDYRLMYTAAAPAVEITITPATPIATSQILVIPRAVPGGGGQQMYDRYVQDVRAFDSAGAPLKVERDEGPRWRLGAAGSQVARVTYRVNVARMEQEILGAADASRVREGYAGLLGYSIFGYLDGAENAPVRLEISAPAGWPVFSTLAPGAPPATSTMKAEAKNFYALADSQIMMGPKMQVHRSDGKVPLYLVVYAETEEDIAAEAALARRALDGVIAYFGSAPFEHYTVHVELLKPLTPQHNYGMSMEHLNSGTFYLPLERAITATSTPAQRTANLYNYAHHMAHSWIPKRAYGEGYYPHRWEVAPLLDAFWFHEGFVRDVAWQAVAGSMPPEDGRAYLERAHAGMRRIVNEAPQFIRKMPLLELSRVGSFLYSEDFRIGRNVFARGALMAAEMDARIRERTAGKMGLRDALRGLLAWSAKNQRAFRIEELPAIFAEATGVDTRDILDRWLRPLE